VPPIFLTGLMGSGKSTVGRRLARRLAATFVDHDERVERMFGRSIAEMFAAGEAEFRAREHAAFAALLGEPAFAAREVVVATGGGLVLDPRHRDAMAACGRVVWLHVDLVALAGRLEGEADRRPLLAGGPVAERLAALARERDAAYRDRALVVDAAADPDRVVERVVAALDGGPP
jgi:shikimate kinase